ncbi:hypothetical protein [Corallococcus macrosporus]|nr:hypothetical protein [Corallococcus macrosporus]
MPLNVQVLFNRPQHEIASLLRDRLSRCIETSIVVGFATIDGLEAIAPTLLFPSAKLRVLVVGAGTFRAFDTMDRLGAQGVPPDRLRIHLGHTRPWRNVASTFQKYHPMLHSKIFYCEMPNGEAAAFVGSHNLTHFAMNGLNGEASVLLEGPASDPQFVTIREHIDCCITDSVEYDPGMKEALTWWTTQFIDGLRKKVNDQPQDAEKRVTILVLATAAGMPNNKDVIYFEIPKGLPQIERIGTTVHIFGFDSLPSSPGRALASLHTARFSLKCRTLGIEEDTGGRELEADWEVVNGAVPRLQSTAGRVRPSRRSDNEQVRVEVLGRLKERYEYLFRGPSDEWLPIYDSQTVLKVRPDQAELLTGLRLDPQEDGEYRLVRGLELKEPKGKQRYMSALERTSPESGNFILFSQRRRLRSGDEKQQHEVNED